MYWRVRVFSSRWVFFYIFLHFLYISGTSWHEHEKKSLKGKHENKIMELTCPLNVQNETTEATAIPRYWCERASWYGRRAAYHSVIIRGIFFTSLSFFSKGHLKGTFQRTFEHNKEWIRKKIGMQPILVVGVINRGPGVSFILFVPHPFQLSSGVTYYFIRLWEQ